MKHVGLYIFKPSTLQAFSNLRESPLERVERLEQLRLLEAGYKIGVSIVRPEIFSDTVEVDTEADLQQAREIAAR